MNIPVSKEEVKPFLERSDAKAWWVVVSTWLGIIGIFVVAALLPHWSTYIIAVFLLAGRQQALAAIMHEAGHKTLFATRSYNKFVAKWLSSPFLLMDGETYIKSHMLHHRRAGTDQDPDLQNYKDYPVTKLSLVRKFTRDFLGITGLKANLYLFLSGRDLLSRKKRINFQLTRGLFVNGVMFSMLWAFGFPQLYILWVIAYLTVYMAIIRMRQIAEHAGVKDLYHLEPKYNTRSVPRGILGLLFVSPTDGLSYHCEHHAFMAVPTYNLKALHKLLKERGYYDDVELADNYLGVLKQVVR
ncbi:fatty acid desaturase family protein [Microbulbifer sp. VTAC004]|uniref:fatty acid desaturase family protein n=1 Tax=unclassified Microbulbifer TaxID=2619833 RepID=UPI00403A5C8D